LECLEVFEKPAV